MQREIILTGDGSHSISIPAMQVMYHSLHGAIQESMHVFIHAGLKPLLASFPGRPIRILEIGLGTGLNALLTANIAGQQQQAIHYTGIEPYPITPEEAATLNYCTQLGVPERQPWFEELHLAAWEKELSLTGSFTLLKSAHPLSADAPDRFSHPFDLIYFDAFAPGAQPAMWTKEFFSLIASLAAPGAQLVTYCSKSVVRRAMQAAGFTVKKIPGPWGKREMLRATKDELSI